MSIPSRDGSTRSLLLLALLAMIAAMASASALAPTASAGYFTFCQRYFNPDPQDNCYGERHSLTSSRATSGSGQGAYYTVAAAALNTNFTIYGSWVYGDGDVCHPYGGSNILYPWIYNAANFRQFVNGSAWYGQDRLCG